MADLTGPKASFIKLVSSDDHEFIIRKDVALTSGHEREKFYSLGKFSHEALPRLIFSLFLAKLNWSEASLRSFLAKLNWSEALLRSFLVILN